MSHLNSARFKGAQWGHAEIKEIEKDGQDLIIRGVASTGKVDRANEKVDQGSLKKAIKSFSTRTLFHMHNWNAAIGKVLKLQSVDDQLLVEASVGKNFDIPIVVQSLFGASIAMTSVNNIREQIKQGIMSAFSIGFTADKEYARDKDGEIDPDKPATLMVNELLELSVVSIPANKDCLFSLAKGFTANELAGLYDLDYQQSGLWTADSSNVETITINTTDANAITFAPNTWTGNDLVLPKDVAASDGEDDDMEELIGGLQECLNRMKRS